MRYPLDMRNVVTASLLSAAACSSPGSLSPRPSPCDGPSTFADGPPSPEAGSPRRFLRRLRTPPPVERPACDFSGTYRGWLGSKGFNVWLAKAPDGSLSGVSHYDTVAGPTRKLSGSASADGSFSLRQHTSVQLQGTCDRNTGFLEGTFDGGDGRGELRLYPEPAGYPAVFHYEQSQRSGACKASVASLGYFGGTDSTNEATTHALVTGVIPVKMPEFDLCDPPPFEINVATFVDGYGSGFLTTYSLALLGPQRAIPRPNAVVDLGTGMRVELEQFVADTKPLERIVPRCMDEAIAVHKMNDLEVVEAPAADYGDDPCRNYPHPERLWFCGASSGEPAPRWMPTSEGIVINASFVLSWSTLKALGILARDAPLRHLWENATPAHSHEPPCSAGPIVGTMGEAIRFVRWESFTRQ